MTDPLDQDLLHDVGQLFVIGFDGPRKSCPPAVQEALSAGRLSGVILFRRNVEDLDQLLSLIGDIYSAADPCPELPFVAVDQEGGKVVRVTEPLTPLPAMRRVGAAADLREVGRVSEVIATEIGALGFNLNFAPVLDVDTNPDNPVIGDRSFSRDPERVARCGAGFLMGHFTAGVVPCGKHFPGHGDTDVDSHLGLPRLDHDLDRLSSVELFPFERAIAAGVPMLMTAHILLPALDDRHPATLSRPILTGLLREKLGFDGVIVTDCLEMKAVAEHYDIEEMVALGLHAGVDLFLICHTEEKWQRAIDFLYRRAVEDPAIRARVQESAARVRRVKSELLSHLPRPWTPPAHLDQVLGCQEHHDTVAPYLGDESIADDPTETT